MSYWWLSPCWKATRCAVCGDNVWDSGGDPDWGLCFDHFSERVRQPPPYGLEEPTLPPCDICGLHIAITGVEGYGVCSKECAEEAYARQESEEEIGEC